VEPVDVRPGSFRYPLFGEPLPCRKGDHAAGWETSHLLALHPETVDLAQLPPKGSDLVGIMVSNMLPQDSTAEFGRRTLEESAEVVVKEVAHRLAHQELYRQHGGSLQEGLWKKES